MVYPDRDHLKRICDTIYFEPDTTGHRIWYDKGTNAEVKSLAVIPSLRTLEGKVSTGA